MQMFLVDWHVRGVARLACQPKLVSLADCIAGFDLHVAQMAIEGIIRFWTISKLQANLLSVCTLVQRRNEFNRAVGNGIDRRPDLCFQVPTLVHPRSTIAYFSEFVRWLAFCSNPHEDKRVLQQANRGLRLI